MNQIKIVVYHYDVSKVNDLWNQSNGHQLTWKYPKAISSPMLTTSIASPWYKLCMVSSNQCEVPEPFLKTLNDKEIQFLTEKEYYEKLMS